MDDLPSSSSYHKYNCLVLFLAAVLFLYQPSDVFAFRDITTLSFDDGFKPLFGDANLVRPDDGNARILLDRFTGAGFITSDMYKHGFFSARIKLPSAYTAGVVVAFYMSNGEVFVKTHDELDIEFLGNIRGKPWSVISVIWGANRHVPRGTPPPYLPSLSPFPGQKRKQQIYFRKIPEINRTYAPPHTIVNRPWLLHESCSPRRPLRNGTSGARNRRPSCRKNPPTHAAPIDHPLPELK